MFERTPVESLVQHAATDPGRRAYVHLDEDGAESAALTYGELHAAALAVAGRLESHCRPGDRALLIFGPGLDMIVAWFGCLYAGVIAVPVNRPRRGHLQAATRSIARDADPAVVLVDANIATVARPALEAECGTLPWLVLGDPDASPPRVPDEPRKADRDEVAFLQYTSGSTAAPKGVMVTHANLAANEEMIRLAFGHDERSTVVGWAPLFHDQGLIGNVLQPMHVGALAVLMSPAAFVRRPLLWPAAVSRYRAHTSGGPDFAFALAAAAAERHGVDGLDLSCWEVAFDGAEPIHVETLRRFEAAFAPAGLRPGALYPCYGLAEATLLVTGSAKGRGPRILDADVDELEKGRCVPAAPGRPARALAGSGRVLPGERVVVVDPDSGRPVPAPVIGEIRVAGDHVTAGYWRNPDATAATFVAGEDSARFLCTGDLGVVVDGELYVVGRHKDVMILRGRNHYPQDIERTVVGAHPAVRPGGCVAFSVPRGGQEQLVVVAELIHDGGDHDLGAITVEVRAAVLREHDVSPSDVVLLARGRTVEKTSSGKLRRAAAREAYLRNFPMVEQGEPVSGPGFDAQQLRSTRRILS